MNCPHPAVFAEHLRTDPAQLARSWYMFFFQLPWLPETLLGLSGAWPVALALRRSAVHKDAFTDDDMRVLRQAASQPGALGSAINYYRAIFRSDEAAASWPAWLRRFVHGTEAAAVVPRRLEDWPKIAAPTLLLWGEEDVALGKQLTEGMGPLFSGPFTRTYIPGCGHWVQQEEPERVSAALLDFLVDVRPAERTAPSPA